MVNAIYEAMTDKTKDQYKVIEERYNILKRYLKEFFELKYSMTAADVKLILNAIEPYEFEYEDEEEDEHEDDEEEVLEPES